MHNQLNATSRLATRPAFNPSAELSIASWRPLVEANIQKEAAAIIENGMLLVLPQLPFELSQAESDFLRPDVVSSRAKAIKYFLPSNKLWGYAENEKNIQLLEGLLKRYAESARELVARLFPRYMPNIITGNTSFRPVEAQERVQSLRQNDRLLHIDAFPSRPSKGQRLLRVFTNINPEGKERVWRVGEAFEGLLAQFVPRMSEPFPGSTYILKFFKITKQLRTPYDHYMLQLHDLMKRDSGYQAHGTQAMVSFPVGSSWIMFSDQVPHAAVSGQHVMEQTFMLPAGAQYNVQASPLKVMERVMGKKLV